jgi:hypothetical protein
VHAWVVGQGSESIRPGGMLPLRDDSIRPVPDAEPGLTAPRAVPSTIQRGDSEGSDDPTENEASDICRDGNNVQPATPKSVQDHEHDHGEDDSRHGVSHTSQIEPQMVTGRGYVSVAAIRRFRSEGAAPTSRGANRNNKRETEEVRPGDGAG